MGFGEEIKQEQSYNVNLMHHFWGSEVHEQFVIVTKGDPGQLLPYDAGSSFNMQFVHIYIPGTYFLTTLIIII